VKNRWAV